MKTPMMPARMPPVASARMIAIGCTWTVRPMMIGYSRWPSTCCTASTSAKTSSALTMPPLTSAIRTAARPAENAPTSGRNAATNVSSMSGPTSGTPRITRPVPISPASTAPTNARPRTYPASAV